MCIQLQPSCINYVHQCSDICNVLAVHVHYIYAHTCTAMETCYTHTDTKDFSISDTEHKAVIP